MANEVNVTMCMHEHEGELSPIYKQDNSPEEDGCFNENADKVKRVDETWSDTNLVHEYPKGYEFKRLVCRNCRSNHFYVLSTGDYETSAKCCECGMYYIVHSG